MLRLFAARQTVQGTGVRHSFEEPASGVRFGGQPPRIGAQVEIAISKLQWKWQRDFEVDPRYGDHRGRTMVAVLPHEADAFHFSQRAAQEGIDADVANAVFIDVHPHMVGRVTEFLGHRQAIHGFGRRQRMRHLQVQFAIAIAVVPAARKQRFAVGDELGYGSSAAILHQRFVQEGAGSESRHFIGVGLLPEDRAIRVVLRGAPLFCPAGLRQGNELADGRSPAILDLCFFEERAGHGDYRSSFFPNSSPPSAMVTPSEGILNAWPSLYEATRSVTSLSSLDSAAFFLLLAASS